MFFFPGFPAGLYSAPMDLPGGSIKDAVDVSSAGEQAIYDIYDKLAEKFPCLFQKSFDDRKSIF